MLKDSIRIGTRGSAMARQQSETVAEKLRAIYKGLKVEIVILTTQGDRVLDKPLPLIGGKGVFTAELETALREKKIDLAVHSLKDLPTAYPEGLTVGAVTARADVNDALISQGKLTIAQLRQGAVIGSSSLRRIAQLRRIRPDLQIKDIRGNADTRVKKVLELKEYDATLLAYAGLERLNLQPIIAELISITDILPAPGQGAVAVQCRDDVESLELLKPLNHADTNACVTAERSFLSALGGGCAVPVAAYATLEGDKMTLRGRVTAVDAKSQVHVEVCGVVKRPQDAYQLGITTAKEALSQGAGEILAARHHKSQ